MSINRTSPIPHQNRNLSPFNRINFIHQNYDMRKNRLMSELKILNNEENRFARRLSNRRENTQTLNKIIGDLHTKQNNIIKQLTPLPQQQTLSHSPQIKFNYLPSSRKTILKEGKVLGRRVIQQNIIHGAAVMIQQRTSRNGRVIRQNTYKTPDIVKSPYYQDVQRNDRNLW